MKNILFIVSLIFGPDLGADPHVTIWSMQRVDEATCRREAADEMRERPAGRIGNLPGYRYVRAAWCEDRNEAWPGNGGVPLLDGSVLTQGPYTPRDKAERDRWTPLWTPWAGWSK